MKIEFERYERDCPANRQRHAGREMGAFIYDFKVIIDGEHRAILSREVYGKGYRLYDAAHRPIVESAGNRYAHMGLEVEKQADFADAVRAQIDRIPSAWGLSELACAEALIDIQITVEARKRLRQDAINKHADAVFDALVHLTNTATSNMQDRLAASDADESLRRALKRHEASS